MDGSGEGIAALDNLDYNLNELPVNLNINSENDEDICRVDADEDTSSGTPNDVEVDCTNEGDNVEEPYVGQEFRSEEEAYKFYNSYAKANGFSVRKNRTRLDAKKEIVYRNLCCSKEGMKRADTRKNNRNPKYEKRDSRSNCKACIDLERNEVGIWWVVRFIAEHNHQLLDPTQSYTLKSHRNVKDNHMAHFIKLANAVGLKTSKTFDFLIEQNGGHQNVGFLRGDHYNYLSVQRKKEMDKGDAVILMEYLNRKKVGDKGFNFDMQLDCDLQVTNFFWAEGRSISDYNYFGDVVCFDTTYKTNNHGRPIGVFVGLNHHRHTCVFGSTMLYDETKESYLWLFSTFLKTMSGKAPITILTDQDAAMAYAIKRVFPASKHRICVWHLCQNAPRNLGGAYNLEVNGQKFSNAFKRCIYEEGDDEKSFKDRWDKMLADYKLTGSEWLNRLFGIKEKWALIYGREAFAGGMSSTQRSESFNAHMKGHLNSTSELHEFLAKYDRLLKIQRLKEFEADCKDITSRFRPVIGSSIIGHLNNLYTGESYKYQEDEYKEMWNTRLIGVQCMGDVKAYEIGSLTYNSTKLVQYNEVTKSIVCSCKAFEFKGIVCRHMFWVLQQEGVTKLPDKCIVRRWMKVAKDNIQFEWADKNEGVDDDVVRSKRAAHVHGMYLRILDEAVGDDATYKKCVGMMENILKNMSKVKADGQCGADNQVNSEFPRDGEDILHGSQITPNAAGTFDEFPSQDDPPPLTLTSSHAECGVEGYEANTGIKFVGVKKKKSQKGIHNRHKSCIEINRKKKSRKQMKLPRLINLNAPVNVDAYHPHFVPPTMDGDQMDPMLTVCPTSTSYMDLLTGFGTPTPAHDTFDLRSYAYGS